MRAHFKKGRLPANARWGGVCPARDQSSMRKFRAICRGGIYAARQFCSSRPIPRRGGVTPPYRAIKMCPRGGHTLSLIYYFFFLI